MGSKSRNLATVLAAVPGLVGLLGLEHCYLGRRPKGVFFLLIGLATYCFGPFLVYLAMFSIGAKPPPYNSGDSDNQGVFAVGLLLWIAYIVLYT
ncbi:MAG: hypothetical protein HY671_03930 [Chloroflexi bacterium]|nr:hypothetical protein [Chloroflexota bacterium]